MMCARTEEEALARGLEGGNFFGYSLGHYYVFGDHKPGTTDVWKEYVEKRAEHGYSPEVAVALEQERLGAKVAAGDTTGLRGATGTPEQIREYFQRFEEAGVDQMIFVMQAGKNQHEHICEAIEMFGKEVLPEFKDRDDKIGRRRRRSGSRRSSSRRWRARSTTRRSSREDYSMKAIPMQMVEATKNEEGKKWIEKFAEDRAKGERDATLGILG